MTLRIFALTACLFLPATGMAQSLPPLSNDPPATESPSEEGATDLLGRGFGIILDQLMTEMEPGLDHLGRDMSGALSRLGPTLGDLSVLIDDLGNYQAPERLENGDVILRRKPGAPPPPPIGDNLRRFTTPDAAPITPAPGDPAQPEISL